MVYRAYDARANGKFVSIDSKFDFGKEKRSCPQSYLTKIILMNQIICLIIAI
jgi:hypothetical protein